MVHPLALWCSWVQALHCITHIVRKGKFRLLVVMKGSIHARTLQDMTDLQGHMPRRLHIQTYKRTKPVPFSEA